MVQKSSEGTGTRPFVCPIDDAKFFGKMCIGFGSVLNEEQADDDILELENDIQQIPLGVGSEEELIAWARGLRSNSDFFPDGIEITGIWIECVSAERGRIPWEKGDELKSMALLLDGNVTAEELDYDDMPIRRVPARASH